MTDFDMPAAGATFEARGGWVVRRLCADLDLQDFQASGIVGNLGYESGGFKSLQELKPSVAGSRGGYGWPQWTGPRRKAFEAWCAEQGLAPSSDQANYGYLLVELRGEYASTVAAVKRTATLAAAVFSVGETYERPGGTTATFLPGNADRLKWAQRALNGACLSGATPEAQPNKPAENSSVAVAPVDIKVNLAPVPAPPKSKTVSRPRRRFDDSDAEAERLNRAELDHLT